MLASTWNSAPATVNGLASRSASWSAASRATSLGLVAREVAEQEHELVAAVAREQPALALGAAQPPGHAAQQPVAGAVAERVVDELEVVEVHEQQRDRALAPPRARDRRPHARLELRAVRQPGQRVEEREPPQLLLGPHAVGDVLARQHGHHAALGVDQRGRLPGDPAAPPAARDARRAS